MQSEGNQEGRRVAGRYHLLEPIGRGGMGTVWRAHDELLDRTVAIKEVRYSAALGEDVQTLNQRLLREARAAARLTHPNVVVVYDVIEENQQPWIVMQLVQSRSLGQVLREDGPLPPRRVAEIGLALLGALQSAHDAGVLHRDVKPENVLLAENGRVVLTDFGIAKLDSESTLTMTGVAGTPAFIAPERLRGLPARRESDLWSLGATLYAAVEGRSPHDRKMPLPTMHSVMTDPPDPARNAGPLLPVLEGLLRKEPVQRLTYAEASAMLRKVTEGRSPTQPWLIRPASSSPAGAAPAGDGPPAAPERRKPYGSPAPRKPASPPPPAGRPAGSPAVPPARERPVTPPERERPAVPSERERPAVPPAGRTSVPRPGGDRTDTPSPQGKASRQDGKSGPAERDAPAEHREAGTAPESGAAAAVVIPQTGQVVPPPSAREAASSGRDAAPPAEDAAPPAGGASASPAAASGDAPPPGGAAAEGGSTAGGSAEEGSAASGAPSAPSPSPAPSPAPSPSPDIRKYVRSLVPEEPVEPAPPTVAAPAPSPAPVRRDGPVPGPADQERTRLGTAAFTGGAGPTALPGIRRALPIVVGALILVGGVGVWIGMNSGDDGDAGTAGQSRPSASAPAGSPTEPGGSGEPGSGESSQDPSSPAPSPSKSEKKDEEEKDEKDGSKLPSGWRMHKDSFGFSIGLPKGWKVERRQGTQVRFRGPDDRRSYLMIDYTDDPGPDSKKDWDVYEPQARGGFPGYKRIRIEKVDYMEDAADWEFTWEPGYGKVRVLNRGFITKGGRGYAIYWHTPASKWKKNLKLFEGFAATFSSKK